MKRNPHYVEELRAWLRRVEYPVTESLSDVVTELDDDEVAQLLSDEVDSTRSQVR